ncbi:hypothetical protein [Litoribrevibacter albus]|uniref:pEK499-p136 HEPN domain-containing protein n=1 Tax=Litoribrevibacter albus TaxID=1473156 RepID=A0AA37W933_9GAMM|nr:hypothetical protein [Litoribrevibacter albus]GLQ32744.1 hypothetical protein GCM10007876_32230 [Litoribrevibacter albus]
MKTTTDWNILIQGYMSLIWCQESTKPENQNKKVSELLSEFQKRNNGVLPLNIGSMLSAAYICFMYPQQSEFDELDFSAIDTSCFSIKLGKKNDSKYICRRIRNSLAHAHFEIFNSSFRFLDQTSQGKDRFEAEIKIKDFGSFLNDFFHISKNQSFNQTDKGQPL